MSEPTAEKEVDGQESMEAVPKSDIPEETDITPTGSDIPVSKRRQRRQAKYEERKARKAEEKIKVKEEKKKRKEEALKRFSELPEEEKERRAKIKRAKSDQNKLDKANKKKKLMEAMENGPRLVIDMGFAHLMYEKEVCSMCQQLGMSYANIGKAEKPFHLLFTDFNGPVKERFQKQWTVAEGGEWAVTTDSRSYLEFFESERENIVYLTPDSQNILEELDEKAIYVIGGFVDRNRHKGFTFKKAKENEIKTAAFPIDQHLSMKASTVLTVDQCVAIMSHRRDTGSWETALERVIPNRKRKDAGTEEAEKDTQETSKKPKES
ncbi:hypothetical protein BSKO_09881 [Bryopsis sp. KO-2023]|nr:hypothetical protein BSKO_09881 [Bryopsis sp. KO-2023]